MTLSIVVKCLKSFMHMVSLNNLSMSSRTCTAPQAQVLSPDGETEPFQVTSGVLQGNTLVPYLFVMVLDDYALWKATQAREEELEILPKEMTKQVHRSSGTNRPGLCWWCCIVVWRDLASLGTPEESCNWISQHWIKGQCQED